MSKRKLSPQEMLDEEGRAHCQDYREMADKCRYCALHGGFKFCKCFRPVRKTTVTGGLF